MWVVGIVTLIIGGLRNIPKIDILTFVIYGRT